MSVSKVHRLVSTAKLSEMTLTSDELALLAYLFSPIYEPSGAADSVGEASGSRWLSSEGSSKRMVR